MEATRFELGQTSKNQDELIFVIFHRKLNCMRILKTTNSLRQNIQQKKLPSFCVEMAVLVKCSGQN